MFVHVLSKSGQPLMPMHPANARKLLRDEKAQVAKTKTGVFTIQLNYESLTYTQPITVGIDTGSKSVPIAAEGNGKIYYAKEKLLRTDVKKRLSDRRQQRRTRRHRKTRYRKPRFLNRTKTKCSRCGVNNVPCLWTLKKREEGQTKKWVKGRRKSLCRPCKGHKGEHKQPTVLAPSIKNRAESILNDVERLRKTLPISKVVVETASFDTQKMADPKIKGVEYQQGTLAGYELKEYLLIVNKHTCAYCGKKDVPLEREHILPKAKGGSDRIDNATVACVSCNAEKGARTLDQWEESLPEADARREKIQRVRKNANVKKEFQYSALTQSYKNYLMKSLREQFPVIEETYGYMTKFYRIRRKLDKTQINDAMVIASEGEPFQLPDRFLIEKQIKKRHPYHSISDRHGYKIVKYKRDPEKYGFRLWDRVSFNHKEFGEVVAYISALKKDGYFEMRDIEGGKIKGKRPTCSHKKLKLIEPARTNYIREWRVTRTSTSSDFVDPLLAGPAEQLHLFSLMS